TREALLAFGAWLAACGAREDARVLVAHGGRLFAHRLLACELARSGLACETLLGAGAAPRDAAARLFFADTLVAWRRGALVPRRGGLALEALVRRYGLAPRLPPAPWSGFVPGGDTAAGSSAA